MIDRTFRAARYRYILRQRRLRTMPSSHTNKYTTGIITMYRSPFRYHDKLKDQPAYIESVDNSNGRPDEWRYSITTRKGHDPFYAGEHALRLMSALEFLFFKHPKDGTFMVGRNPALHFLLFLVMASAVVYGSIALGGWGWQAPVALEVGTTFMYLLGTWLQYRGIWK